MDEVDLFGTGLLRTVANGPFFYFSNGGRNTDHHTPARREKWFFGINHLDHFTEHELGGIKVGNYTVFEGANGFNTLVGFFMHHQGAFAYGQDFFRVVTVQSDNGGFIHYDFVIVDYQGIGGSQVYRDLLREPVK